MNRSASAAYYPFQVMPRFLLGRQGEVYYAAATGNTKRSEDP